MIKVASAGRFFMQGWNDKTATPDEKPGMKVLFTYDYWLDSTEITQKHFFDLMRRNPVPPNSQFGVGDRYPVYNVSWFDAALFCNARSLAEGLDTVYSYSGIKTQANGSVYELAGLLCDFSRDGYRLPTESEWEFAARNGSDTGLLFSSSDSAVVWNKAWYFPNSSGTSHPVGTKQPSALGFSDLAGNVFEWANDWKTAYDGRAITNCLGGRQPNVQYEKVVKGGAYGYDASHLRPSGRSATYSTTLYATCAYVGFRCARGIIPNGQYIGSVSQTFTPNPVSICVTVDSIRSFAGTGGIKIAFVNVTGVHRTLCVVDFSATIPHVLEFLDDSTVYAPSISPDGHFVAYCSNTTGMTGPSVITIRSLDSLGTKKVRLDADSAYSPRWWVDPASQCTYLVYTNSTISNESSLWGSTHTCMQMVTDGRPSGPLQVIDPAGSYYGGCSADGRYLVTGYSRLMARDRSINSERQLFLSPHNGKNGAGSTQVCNVSISPDTGADVRCLFLDFGYPGTSSITGTGYDIHQYLFESTMTDSITGFMRFPSGEKSWDNPSWSNNPRFAVACVRNGEDQAHAVHLVDLVGRCSMGVVAGTELEQPCCRLNPVMANSDSLSVDSLGLYNDPATSGYQLFSATKFLLFWKVYDSIELAILGSSHFDQVDPTMFSGLKAFSFASAGVDLLGQYEFIIHYLLPHCKRLKVVCSSLDMGWLGNHDGNFSWQDGLAQSKGYRYDSTHGFWKDPSIQFLKAIDQVPSPAAIPTNGFWGYKDRCDGWGLDTPTCANPVSWTGDSANYRQCLSMITSISDSFRARGIHWVLVISPASPKFQNTNFYSLWGPTWAAAGSVINDMKNIASVNPYFHFYDANMGGNHDYDFSEFMDDDHLCSSGAVRFTRRLDSIVELLNVR